MEILQQFPQLKEYSQIILFANAVIGLLLCFMGYAIWRVVLALTGVVIGVWLGLVFGPWIIQSLGQDIPVWTVVLAAAIGWACFLAGIPPIGTFLVAGAWVVGAASAIAAAAGVETQNAVGIGIACGLVAGTVAAAAGRGGVIVVSAISGGVSLIDSSCSLLVLNRASPAWLDSLPQQTQTIVLMGAGLLLGTVGMAIQFVTTKPPPQAITTEEEKPSQSGPDAASAPSVVTSTKTVGLNVDSEVADVAKKLKRLSKLNAQGLITDAELQEKRKQLLSQL